MKKHHPGILSRVHLLPSSKWKGLVWKLFSQGLHSAGGFFTTSSHSTYAVLRVMRACWLTLLQRKSSEVGVPNADALQMTPEMPIALGDCWLGSYGQSLLLHTYCPLPPCQAQLKREQLTSPTLSMCVCALPFV